jgi:serine O-acetyltransferase
MSQESFGKRMSAKLDALREEIEIQMSGGRSRVLEDIGAYLARDPAARNWYTVVFCYPGLKAIWGHRLAHALWQRQWHFAARLLSQVVRFFTGIEIHPAARLGRRLVIDHGHGLVIGETAVVGDDVTLYQGVTLGGTSLTAEKRHPTLGHGVVVGAGAVVIGDITVGDGAKVGANAVVTKDVAAGATVVGVPAAEVTRG